MVTLCCENWLKELFVLCILPLFLVTRVGTAAGSGSCVFGERDFVGVDALDILNKDLIVPLHFLCSFPTNCSGNIIPAVRGVLVIHRKRLFKGFVLLGSPG